MSIETKLKDILQRLNFYYFSNKKELLKSLEELNKILNPSFLMESFQEIITALKANQLYREFKLDADPEIFRAIVNKVNDITMIEKLLSLSSEINYSESEKKVLDQRLAILIALSFLDDDLDENMDNESNFFEVYFQDLKELKKIFSSEYITPDNIKWFLHSDLFEFISEATECFDVNLEDLYECMIQNTDINTKKDFSFHKQILENAKKEVESFDYEAFYAVLSKTKKQLTDNLRKSSTLLNHNSFYKSPKSIGLSKTAQKAWLNIYKKYTAPYPNGLNEALKNLKECNDSPNLNNLNR
jgi:hypothetical protein